MAIFAIYTVIFSGSIETTVSKSAGLSFDMPGRESTPPDKLPSGSIHSQLAILSVKFPASSSGEGISLLPDSSSFGEVTSPLADSSSLEEETSPLTDSLSLFTTEASLGLAFFSPAPALEAMDLSYIPPFLFK